MTKKRYNAIARTNPTVEIDNSTVKKVIYYKNVILKSIIWLLFTFFLQIQVENGNSKETYDACNEFSIPAEKRKTKKIDKNKKVTPFLSKKRRKQLEKIVERKEKKLQVII